MPESKIISPSPAGPNVIKGGATFTGDVYLSMLYHEPSAAMAHVTFTPCARTHWHTHEKGQHLQVLHGQGWICDKGSSPRRIKAGDLIWAPPGTTHWHGADGKSVMTHLAVGLGATTWGERVTDEEFGAAGKT
ncbi:RmlC-like cupin [Aureobasidium pullulans]|nr:RmlC-like cupin [Aureobasidium pullulans]THZ25133.1 RmlC-like cupin [Aureobasidium pullulans]THZ50842.1 RmlC-like cupin [Aureobasidium pullulans]